MVDDARISPARAERADLVAALRGADPAAPTLCEGWTVLDLAAHLVSRERRPDSLLGLQGGPLAGYTDRVRQQYARHSLSELADMLEAGPPRLSLFGLPGVDAKANLGEFFVHCEDVRRGTGDLTPRDLPPWRRAALWSVASTIGRLTYRSTHVGVTLDSADGRSAVVRRGTPAAVVHGDPGELVLHAFGRRAHATVTLTGDPSAVTALT